MGLFAFYTSRGWTLEALSQASPAELAFLEGARALYYEEQISMLRDLRCDAFQGFRFAVPLPELEARKRILSGNRTLNGLAQKQEEIYHA